MASTSGSNRVLDFQPALEAPAGYHLVPCQEYFLQGPIRADHVNDLLEILQGLCDDFEERIHTFRDHETHYECEIGNVFGRPLQLRGRRSLLHEKAPCMVRYVGRTERSIPSQPTAVRTSIDVGLTGNIDEFLVCSGFKKTFEYFASGYMFRKGRMKVTIMEARSAESAPRSIVPPYRLITDSFFVKMSIVKRAGMSAAGDEMREFADSLKPIVGMIKPE